MLLMLLPRFDYFRHTELFEWYHVNIHTPFRLRG